MSNLLDFISVGINSLVLFVAVYQSYILLSFVITLPIVTYCIVGYPWFQDPLRPRGSRSSTLEVKVINSKPSREI